MINPHKITDFTRSQRDLQEFLLFCVCVAGKSSAQQAKKLELFLSNHVELTPFQMLRMYGYHGTMENLQQVRMGQYNRITKAFQFASLTDMDLTACTVGDLEKIHGIGMKTARFFLTHSRPNQEYAILDTHVLKHLRSLGINAPKATPTNPKKYYELERQLLGIIKASGKSYADYDLEVWSKSVKKVPA